MQDKHLLFRVYNGQEPTYMRIRTSPTTTIEDIRSCIADWMDVSSERVLLYLSKINPTDRMLDFVKLHGTTFDAFILKAP